MQLKIGYPFQCPPWAKSFCPFRACGAKRAPVLSGRVGQSVLLPLQGGGLGAFTFLPFNFYNVVSAMLSRQSSVLVVLDFLDRNEDG